MTYPSHTCFVSMAYAWRTCYVAVANHSYVKRTCTAFLYGLSLVPVFFVLVKIHSKCTRSHCVSSDQDATYMYLLRYFRSHGVGVTYVHAMENRSCYEPAAILF